MKNHNIHRQHRQHRPSLQHPRSNLPQRSLESAFEYEEQQHRRQYTPSMQSSMQQNTLTPSHLQPIPPPQNLSFFQTHPPRTTAIPQNTSPLQFENTPRYRPSFYVGGWVNFSAVATSPDRSIDQSIRELEKRIGISDGWLKHNYFGDCKGKSFPELWFKEKERLLLF